MAGPGRYLLPSVRIPDATSTEVAHLATLAEDVIEALPSSLTRSMSDLKELDAVLGGSLAAITDKLNRLLQVIYNEQASPQERLILLKEVAEDVVAFKLGGEDKIRVATGTCETILQHSAQLDMIASLLASLMPPVMVANMPASATPSGYPTLFPSFAAAANTATAHIARPRQDFFQPQGAPPPSHASQYASAAEQVNAYRSQGRLQPLKSHKGRHANAYTSTAASGGGQGSSSSSSSKRPYAQTSSNDNKRAKTHASNLAQSDVYADSPPKRRKTGNNNNNNNNDDLHLDTQTARMDDGSALPSPAMAGHQQPQQQMAGYSPAAAQDKQTQKRRGGPSNRKGTDYSPDISAASTPTLGASGGMQASSRQPRRRAAQTSYYADDDEEDDPSAAEVASPAEDDDQAHLYAAHTQSNKNLNAPDSGRPQATKRRSGHSGISQPASLPQQQQQHVEEGEEDPTEEEEADEQDDDGAHDGLLGSAGNGAAAGGGGAGAGAGGSGSGREKLYCYCQSVSYGEMIGCDNDDCAKEWFHLDCLGLKQAPSGTWYCDECKAAMGNAGRRGRR